MRFLSSPSLAGVSGADSINTVGADIASASSINLAAATGTTVTITGTTTITALGTAAAGVVRHLLFSECLEFAHSNTSLILPGNRALFCVPGDVATFISLGGGNWKLMSFTPIHPLAHKVTLNIASACTPTNTGTIGGNGYFNGSSYLTYVVPAAVGFGKVTPHNLSGANQVGLLPGGTAGPNYVDWTRPFKVTLRFNGRVSTKAGGSAGAFCMFAGCNPTAISLGTEGGLCVMRGTDATTGVNYTAYAHDGTTLNTGATTTGTLASTAIIELEMRWVPGKGFYWLRDGSCVARATGNNIPTGDGVADGNVFGWGLENVAGNTVQAQSFVNSVVVST